MTVLGQYTKGDILITQSTDGAIFLDCVKVLKDFTEYDMRPRFKAQYKGPGRPYSRDYYEYLVEQGYIEVYPTDGKLFL